MHINSKKCQSSVARWALILIRGECPPSGGSVLLVQRDGDLAGTGDTLPGVVRFRVEPLVNRVPDRLARLDHADVDRGAGAVVEDGRPARVALDVVAQLLRVARVAGTGEVAELQGDVRRDRPVVRRGDAVGLLDPGRHVAEREGVVVERDAQGRRGVARRAGVGGREVRAGGRRDRSGDEQGSRHACSDARALLVEELAVLEHGLEGHFVSLSATAAALVGLFRY